MRLFIAVLFNQEMKELLYDASVRLKKMSKGGTFTERENFHLTVNFIGETKRMTEVKDAMRSALENSKAEKFYLSVGGLGCFKRAEGNIYWVDVAKSEVLWRIQRELVKKLKEAGFYDMDERDYKPHITLGRRVKVDHEFDSEAFGADIQPLGMMVKGISLMKSERVEGKLIYTEIYSLDI